MSNAAFERTKQDFENVVELLDGKFGKDYSMRNPGLVQFLLDKNFQYETLLCELNKN